MRIKKFIGLVQVPDHIYKVVTLVGTYETCYHRDFTRLTPSICYILQFIGHHLCTLHCRDRLWQHMGIIWCNSARSESMYNLQLNLPFLCFV